MPAILELKPQDLHTLCRRYLRSADGTQAAATQPTLKFEVQHYELQPISDQPAGFLGRHNFLIVTIAVQHTASNKIEQRTLCFFTKAAPLDIASRMRYLDEFGVFIKEISVYRHILPLLQRDFADVAPKCYYANDNLLIFENLAASGYKMAAKRDGLLDYAHLKCALKTLAAMHAGSMLLESHAGKTIAQLFPAAVKENAYPLHMPATHVRMQNFNNAIAAMQAMLGTMPKYSAQLSHIRSALPKCMQSIFRRAQTSSVYQNVFTHGDLWANNVMFQYGKYGETPIQCRFVDFQLARYAPAMLDLVTLLTIPTTRAFRDEHFMELIAEYYRYMTDLLRVKGLNIANYMPEQQFYASIDEFRVCGLIESCLFSHLTILPESITQELTGSADGFSDFFDRKRVALCMKAFQTDAVYRERLTDMLEDLVDNYVLKM